MLVMSVSPNGQMAMSVNLSAMFIYIKVKACMSEYLIMSQHHTPCYSMCVHIPVMSQHYCDGMGTYLCACHICVTYGEMVSFLLCTSPMAWPFHLPAMDSVAT